MLRSLSLGLVALAALPIGACEPDLPQTTPSPVVTAVFDPTTASIPLPNDLVFLNPVNGVCPSSAPASGSTAACAQAELLQVFSGGSDASKPAFAGNFPSDQEVAITIDFSQTNFSSGTSTQVAPDIDLKTFTPSTFVMSAVDNAGTPREYTLDMLSLSYSKGTDHGTLSIRLPNHQPWPPGAYSVSLRGGPDGIKTTDMTAISASQIFNLIAQGKDMSDPANLGLLRAQTGSIQSALDQGKQLNVLIGIYKASSFMAADLHFPHEQMAITTTFHIAQAVTNVSIDPGRGLAPLPIDLLRNPATGKLTPTAACAFTSTALAADGTCPNPAAAGFLALDGFSTTGAILAPTSDLVKVATITSNSLLLYDLSDAAHPALVDPTTYISEPCEFTSVAPSTPGGACGAATTALSPVIAIQPSGATAGYAPNGDPSSVFRTRPLKDNTDYAVVITTDVLDKGSAPLGSGTVASILKFTNPVNVSGKSALQGIDDGTTAVLEKMRSQLVPVFSALATKSIDKSKVAIAYVFHTQTILSQAVQLAALPYATPAATAAPSAVNPMLPTDAFTKYGVLQALPHGNIDEILETDITTFNAIDPATGAFLADPTKAAAQPIHVLIATPKASNASIPACTGQLAPFGKCSPMMIFRHGLGGGRAQMLLIADTFAAAGMTTVAIDAAMHGDRSFCTKGTTGAASGCVGGAACMSALPDGAQGDAHPPGTCGAAGFVKNPVTPGATGNTDGIPAISGSLPYLLSANFFRTRDTFRQDLIDESQLVRAIAFAPSGAPPTGHTVFDHMVARGVIIDPATIYFSGQSLGAIQGTMDVASNPRISRAGLNVGGGSVVDIFTTSPAFAPAVNQLLAGLGITPGTAAYLQFLTVAKTILDPADPVNFAGHLTANTLPNLLPPLGGKTDGTIPQTPKKILTQVANCDQVVPNPFGLIWASNIAFASTPPGGPLPTGPTFFAPGATGTFQLFVGHDFNPADFGKAAKCTDATAAGALTKGGGHGHLISFENSLTLAAQNDLASFVMSGNPVPSVTVAQ
jgi:hypothetical protein